MRPRMPDSPSRVLVTGGAGYLGSIVAAQLLERGLRVRVLDSLLFGAEALDGLASDANCELIRGDVRDIESVVRAMSGCDTAIHLAGIVGDQACEANRPLAIEVNGAATRMLADVAPRCGVHRFLFASSCSVYGSNRVTVSESSKLRPLSLYAQTKVDSEKILLEARTRNFAPTVLRLGTLFGLSACMRFDLVVNLLVARAMSSGRITIRNGWQWRPLVHVRDAARAFLACLECPAERVSGEVFNVGADFLNAQIRQLGKIVARLVPGTMIADIHDRLDRRSYRVAFDKIERKIGFNCRETLESGVGEIRAAIAACELAGVSVDGSRVRVVERVWGQAAGEQGRRPRQIAALAKRDRPSVALVPVRAGAPKFATGD